MTPEQRDAVEALTLQYGGLMVREGYTDKSICVTTPRLKEIRITEDGTVVPTGHMDASKEAGQWMVGEL